MYPNMRMMRVLESLAENPGEWLDLQCVAKDVNLTARQVSSAVSSFPPGIVEKDKQSPDRNIRIRIAATEESAGPIVTRFYGMAYGIDADMTEIITDALRDGGATLHDLSVKTGLKVPVLIHALPLMRNVSKIGPKFVIGDKDVRNDI